MGDWGRADAMTHRMLLPLFLATGLVTGCEPASPLRGDVVSIRVAMRCDDGQALTVTYAGRQVVLADGTRTLTLAQAVSASGARYVGIDPARDVRVTWWNKGQGASRFEAPAAQPDNGDDPLVATCVEGR